MNRFVRFVSVVSLASLAFLHSPAQADVRYRLSDLGGLGDSDSRALGLNNSGDVVGWAFLPHTEIARAYRFSFAENSVREIHPPGFFASTARDINNAGTIIGRIDTEDHKTQSVIWRPDGRVEYINSGGNTVLATALSDSGLITGSAHFRDESGNSAEHAFWYNSAAMSQNRTVKDLGTLGGQYSFGTGVNSSGIVVGGSLTGASSWQQHAFVCTPESDTRIRMQDLGTLGGAHSQANGVNDRGQIVGWANNSLGQSEAFLYETDSAGGTGGTMRGLGTLGGVSSSASDVNELGDIVGWWSPHGYDRRAFVTINGHMTDLTSLLDPSNTLFGWTLAEAYTINDLGQIAGYGYDPEGVDRAFLLTPVSIPSPSTLTALLPALAILRRKRN